MWRTLGRVVYSMLPIILAGVSNMIYVKMPVHGFLKRPIDNDVRLKDGRPLFGRNKTWKGFIGMTVLTSLWMTVFYTLDLYVPFLRGIILFSSKNISGLHEPLFFGAVWGLGYVLFELPNSFVKRRLSIDSGKNVGGVKGVVFLVIDQADSVIGCTVFMLFFYRPDFLEVVLFLAFGTVIHLVVNMLLFLAGLKKQPA